MKAVVDALKDIIDSEAGNNEDIFEGKLHIDKPRGFRGQSISDEDTFVYVPAHRNEDVIASAYEV